MTTQAVRATPLRPATAAPAGLTAKFFRGLGDPTRIRILQILEDGERTVSELMEETGTLQGRLSSHLACLRWCGYVLATVDGRFNRYQLVDPRVREILVAAESIVRENEDRLTSCLVLGTEAASSADPIRRIDR